MCRLIYRPIAKHHFRLPRNGISWIDLLKSLPDVTYKLCGVVGELVNVRYVSTVKI